MRRILFVCLGNICRSPTAEGVLRAKAPHLEIDSAGTADWHTGKSPYGPAIEAAALRNYDLKPLRARQVHPRDFHEFDLILAMDENNLADLKQIQPENARAKLCLFLDYAPETGQSAVPDPYYTRDFEGALDLIERASDGLIAAIKA
ncbi:MAG: low molecular weight phosphotyrosine protein phosphatase [Boseongicola sp.]|nr:low molecular weight phosphotyrosine protein phosphatase [Boseongicola sp.]